MGGKEEYVDIVDEDDNVIKTATRKEADLALLRKRASRVVVFDDKGMILIHQRAHSKRNYPGKFDIGIAETLKAGEDYQSAALRGLKEEMGISVREIKFLFKYSFSGQQSRHNYCVYSCVYSGNVKPDPGEVAQARFVKVEELERLLRTGQFTDSAVKAWSLYKK